MPLSQFTKNERLFCILTGRLDSNTVGALSAPLQESLSVQQPSLLLDISQLEYLSSAGIRLLLECQKKAKSLGGEVYLIGTPPAIEAILSLTGFVPFFQLVSSQDIALSQATKAHHD